ncbi:helix-turn-helix domain-containing protein [Streptomyces acidiscabies]|uniref:Helix-turn-helix domain-containing protein n=1 Tax=Streptomyces acidiscabies TaxID=42234 RepID=A0AAP6ELP9_9ACTN|nr:helix-turn-helix domain-containing protein [Streptomyces acidiscabies]MBP5937253.1 helix-turn-helix domain-containing protein [Streptomyces sp. LBUM 1476]MBZ3914689.1 helix-turn-helix domain-containing protein [Streptomyces acidiscabies]MDX2967248.1 helix-turn-helix domain-containing protein [Streptomyces acidiscabies]MDX3020603.1 helix-turn-helix domain-containing protein [Streptomyces acidiscabies]MDX3795810.1 helix-turn-helix domain-containing protein [Streptomyces acidiscabies]
MNSGHGDPKELGVFLQARRADLDPLQVGLPDTGTRRRVKGLRREEVAQLAAISTDYYTRVEQARMQASVPVLEAIARALRLTGDQRAYLFELAGRRSEPPARSGREITEHCRRLLDQLTESPAVVLSDTMDVLAWNQLAAALLTDFAQVPEADRNYVWLLFNDPTLRARYEDWPAGAHACVAYLRMHTAHHPDAPRLQHLLERMAPHADFQRWWQNREVAVQGTGNKIFHHPVAGTVTLDWDTLTSSTAPDQHIVIWTAPPDSPSEKGLRLLAAAQTEAVVRVVRA